MATFICYDIDYDELKVLYQWDSNRRVIATDIDAWDNATVFFHFTNTDHNMSFTVQPLVEERTITEEGETIVQTIYTAVIPDELLQIAKPIILLVYQTTDDLENKTIDSTMFSVRPRTKPSSYIYTPTLSPVMIPTGLELDGSTLYIVSGNDRIGSGVEIGGNGALVDDAVPVADGSMLFTIGNAEIDSETVDLLTEPYASHLYNKWFDDYTGQVDDTARPNRVLCDLFIEIPDDRSSYTVQAAVSGSAGQFICYFYDANENFLSSQTVTSWVDSSTLKAIPNAKKLRVLMRLSSNADIAIGNISTFKVLFM